MDRRAVLLAGVGGAAAMFPSGSACGTGTISADEHARTIALMRPRKRARPVVAIVADNVGAETTDLLIPFNVLSRSGLAEVAVLAPAEAPIGSECYDFPGTAVEEPARSAWLRSASRRHATRGRAARRRCDRRRRARASRS